MTEEAKKVKVNPWPGYYKKLSEKINEDNLVTYKEDDKEFTGYRSQVAIDRLNDIFGINGWSYDFEFVREELIGKSWMVVVKCCIRLADMFMSTRPGIGACYARKADTAYKGAVTSAFKNACKYLGIGKELYIKGFEEVVIEEETKEVTNTNINAEAKKLLESINNSKNSEQLESLKTSIKVVNGDAVKKLVTEAYNDKQIELNK